MAIFNSYFDITRGYVIGQSPALPRHVLDSSGHDKKVSLANVKAAVEEAASWTAVEVPSGKLTVCY